MTEPTASHPLTPQAASGVSGLSGDIKRLTRGDLDDRGVPITPLSAAELVRESAAEDDRAARERLAAWLGEAGRRTRSLRGRSWWRWAPLAMTCMILGSCVLSGWGRGYAGLLGCFVPLSLIAGAMYVERRVLPKRYMKSPASLVAEGFCGQCGYGLRELPVQGDGCIVCSECGAAWSKARLTWPWWERGAPSWTTRSDFDRQIGVCLDASRAGHDSRGRIVPVYSWSLVTWGCDNGAGPKLAIFRAANDELLARTRKKRWATAAVFFGGFVLLGLIPWFLPGELSGDRQATNVFWTMLGLTIASILAVGVVGGSWFATPADCSLALASRGLCPACTTIWGRDVVRDGVWIVCPECGSTWVVRESSSGVGAAGTAERGVVGTGGGVGEHSRV